tara:strand:+ start:74 stop:439 length:366 start_codon:yes stop_codon:yes gene_type:complete
MIALGLYIVPNFIMPNPTSSFECKMSPSSANFKLENFDYLESDKILIEMDPIKNIVYPKKLNLNDYTFESKLDIDGARHISKIKSKNGNSNFKMDFNKIALTLRIENIEEKKPIVFNCTQN